MPDLRLVSDAGRLAEIVRLFDAGPDLIPVRDIGWLIDAARERDELRAEVEKQTRLANVAAERMRTAEDDE